MVKVRLLKMQRLFENSTKEINSTINFEDFIQGLSAAPASAGGKLRFLFELYDLQSDGYLDKEELVSMIHNTFKHAMHGSLSTT